MDPVTGQNLDPTPRIKTRRTLVEKLQRSSRLAQIHDIAGARIVVESGRNGQDAVCAAICAAFSDRLDPIDRRADPSFGYRAVHVVVRHNDCWVEIQIRTKLQHQWAETIERIADSWGRQIRYGLPADDPGRPWGNGTRAEALDLYTGEWSDLIADVEELEQTVEAPEHQQHVADLVGRLETVLEDVRSAALEETEA